ncbi:5-oxoprolinase subunit PxpB [Natranaerobius thermophilus]|uniref:Allophanate hydrolase subunit 1 n=1 Tax=Natranaerobius thermophilus (strain ATCC BAA-1301 / DSM 18059 / JW/NM-WN-LF) TaxID=457570 RepID=B2A1I8_NATTJ|nr:5-oxoprolinase subunit PxpB [Natranaerobius thermophilus]ACB84728.1 Allophanate hydrolase subunit 1 [Natranaerobius thermophilus JW/NM-WN-LF]
MSKLQILPAGDKAVVMEFENEISPEVNAKIRATDHLLREEFQLKGITEIIPTYRSLLIYYDEKYWDFETLSKKLVEIPHYLEEKEIPEPKTLNIPVVYGGEYGPDLEYVAEYNNLTSDQVIEIHHTTTYLIYMLGFVPGFTYLGGMSEKIATPRLKDPRAKIPEGSVGIAGSQTGVYPLESPGGWQLIGRTPLKFYDPNKEDPFLPKPGYHLKFYPITEDEYREFKNKY